MRDAIEEAVEEAKTLLGDAQQRRASVVEVPTNLLLRVVVALEHAHQESMELNKVFAAQKPPPVKVRASWWLDHYEDLIRGTEDAPLNERRPRTPQEALAVLCDRYDRTKSAMQKALVRERDARIAAGESFDYPLPGNPNK